MGPQASLILRDIPFEAFGDLFAAEGGALAVLRRGFQLKGAYGDFDSIQEREYQRIVKSGTTIHRVPSVKDVTDSELAIEALLKLGYTEIRVWGALGGRVDHEQVNLVLMRRHPEVVLMSETQVIRAYTEGDYPFERDGHTYFSVFTASEARICLIGFSYPLDHYRLTPECTLTVSNAWDKEKARMVVHEGQVWVVLTREVRK